MDKFVVEGNITVSVNMVLEANNIPHVWEELESRLCPLLCLTGYAHESHISSNITDSNLVVRETT